MKLLILGANGFIGSEVVREALTRNHEVLCIGRNISVAKRRYRDADWRSADISRLTDQHDWQPLLGGIDVVINCAGALQDGLHDDVKSLQQTAMAALYQAAKAMSNIRIVQISANTMRDSHAGSTDFLATKERADDALRNAGIAYSILKPALVVGRNSYGGTSLLRAVASMPFVIVTAQGNQACQTTDMYELASVTLDAAEGKFGDTSEYSVASGEVLSFNQILAELRRWLGLPSTTMVNLPALLAYPATVLADLAGLLGWRSPLRSTAMKVLTEGVVAADNLPLIETRNLRQTLAENPSGVQDLWFARLYLLKPLLIITLSIFWLASGMVALWSFEKSQAYLAVSGLSKENASLLTIATAFLDMLLGATILFRRYARSAAIGMIALSLAYLVSASAIVPALWLEPLGPLVKIAPSILLTFTLLATLEER